MLSKSWMNSMFKHAKEYKEYVNALWDEYSKLVECIESGHDYSNGPECIRCGHYGPEDKLHCTEIELQSVKDRFKEVEAERDQYAKQLQSIKDGYDNIAELASKLSTTATTFGIDIGGIK